MDKRTLVLLACLVFGAVTFVVIGDVAGKLLTSGGVEPFVVAWSRFLLAAAILLPFSGLRGSAWRDLFQGLILLRACFIAAGICCILTALKTEPIANVFGAFFVGPIVSYVLAILFLGERPSRARSLHLAVGFTGVILVVKPGFGATTGMFFAVAAGVFYGTYLALTRLAARDYRPRFLLISQLLIGSVLLSPLGLSGPMPSFDFATMTLIAISALGSAVGNYLLAIANRKAEASLIAPLVYSQLVSATLLGILVFGDWPDLLTLFGLLLILASGLGSLIAHQRTQSAP